jgi:hypothetical protein
MTVRFGLGAQNQIELRGGVAKWLYGAVLEKLFRRKPNASSNLASSAMPKPDITVKLVIYVPQTHADIIRQALGESGAGLVGDYKFCSFSVVGTGRYIPLDTAHPAIGTIGKLEEVVEERIETVCYQKDLNKIITAVKKVHPYEEVAIDIYPLVS